MSITGAAALAFLASVVVSTITAPPASAVAVCASGHICFFEQYHYINGVYSTAGSMSDQTDALTKHPGAVQAQIPFTDWTPIKGKISNFGHSHYWNGTGVNDSISTIQNFTGDCLVMFGNPDFTYDGTVHNQEGILFGPYANKVLVGPNIGDADNKFTSAIVIERSNILCSKVAVNSYTVLSSLRQPAAGARLPTRWKSDQK